MKLNFQFLITALFSLLLSFPANAQWNSIDLPNLPFITNISLWQNTAYAETNHQTLFQSLDQGKTWQKTFPAFGLTINPNNGAFYRFTPDSKRLERSLDGGSNWSDIGENPAFDASSGTLPSLTFSHDTLYTFFAGTLLRLENQSWDLVVQFTGNDAILGCAVSGKHFWLKTSNENSIVMHSADGGMSWVSVAVASQKPITMAAAGDTILLCYYDTGLSTQVISRTIDQGASWQTNSAPLGLDSIGHSRPFWGYSQGAANTVFYAQNGLTDWNTLYTGIPLRTTFTAVELLGNQRIAASTAGLFYGQNGQWQRGDMGFGLPGEINYSITLRKTPELLLVGEDYFGSGTWTRTDATGDWGHAQDGLFSQQILPVGNFWIGTGQAGIYRAPQNANPLEWSVVAPDLTGDLVVLGTVLYLKPQGEKDVFRSDDFGTTWVKTGETPQYPIPGNLQFVGVNGKLFTTDGNSLVASADDGATWIPVQTFPFSIDVGASRLFALNGYIFISYLPLKRVYRYTESNGLLNQLDTPPFSGAAYTFRLRMQGNTLLLTPGDPFLYVSNDYGLQWRQILPVYPGFSFDNIVSGIAANDSMIFVPDAGYGVAWTLNYDSIPPLPPSCLSDGISFHSQWEIDNFILSYPDCKVIGGGVEISGADITNLNGLSSISFIGEILWIHDNPLLTNLQGLDNLSFTKGLRILSNPNLNSLAGLGKLTYVSTDFYIYNNPLLANLGGLESLTSVVGEFSIQSNASLVSLNGLSNLTNVGGYLLLRENNLMPDLTGLEKLTYVGVDLLVENNNLMTSLNGLEKLNYVGHWLLISNNPMLENMEGLNQLTSVGEFFSIRSNPALKNLVGLSKLTNVKDLYIDENQSLTSLDGLESLVSVGQDLVVDRNFALLDIGGGLKGLKTVARDFKINLCLGLLSLGGLENLSEIGGEFYIYANVAMTSLGSFPKLTHIGGNLDMLGNFELLNVNGLESLTTVDGGILISQTDKLTNLDGLINVHTLGSELFLSQNSSLNDLNGLAGLAQIHGSLLIDSNPQLTRVDGLENITSIASYVLIRNNYALASLDSLNKLTTIGGDVIIEYNELTSLSGLGNLKSIGGSLRIENTKLTSLSGLEKLESIGGEIHIVWNPFLSDCSIFSVCNHLLLEPDSVYVGANAFGCNAQDEVVYHCGGTVVEVAVQTDPNGDCSPDPAGLPAAGVQVRLTGTSQMTLRACDMFGMVRFYYLDTGSFTLHVASFPQNNWVDCLNAVTITPVPLTQDTIRETLLLTPLVPCPELSVRLGLPAHFRGCLTTSEVQVTAQNTGTVAAEAVRLAVVLPSAFDLESFFPPFSAQNGDTLFFETGELKPFETVSVTLTVRTKCDTFLLGQTLCWEAFAAMGNACPNTLPAFSEIKLLADCVSDTVVRFTIKNIGDAPTQNLHEYTIIRNESTLSTVSFSLNAHESMVVELPADGATYRMEATKLDDGTLTATALENCGGLTPGQITAFWLDHGPLEYDFDCRQVIGSFDPNQKTAIPAGAGSDHYLAANQTLQYTIDFQNTGTDTAYRVLLRDILDENLDINTFQPGFSSHPYTWEIRGAHDLEVLFSPIMLPDSNANEPASHGFFSFEIAQKPDLVKGTILENTADIIFDFNWPIVTNTVQHTIGKLVVQANEPQKNLGFWKILGNPTQLTATFLTEEYIAGEKRFELFETSGRQVQQAHFNGQSFEFQRNGLPSGLYFFTIKDALGRVFSGKIVITD